MKTHFILYSLLLLSLSLFSCEKADKYDTSPRENFEALWEILDNNYCFFEYKEIDWNEVHDRYSDQVVDSMNQFALFDLLGKMLAELKDGHTNLISSFNVARYWAWYENYPANFNDEIQKKYLGTGMDYGIAGGLKYRRLAEGKIGYAYYGSFASGVGEANLDYLFQHFKDCKGLILDIRDNGGGMLSNADRIASRFADEKRICGYILHKTGNGHTDFSDLYPMYVTPSDRMRWLRPVIVLTNRHCYSATNDFVSKMRLFPQVVILGDKTGGGSGFPFSSELPNGWSVRFSASPILNENKEQIEFGIEPDVKVSMSLEDMEKGKDTLIEEAIKRLTSQEQ